MMYANKTHWPVDTDDAFYIQSNYTTISLGDILDRANKKWPGITISELEIETEYVHLYAVGYDQYDPSDWSMFLKISKTEPETHEKESA